MAREGMEAVLMAVFLLGGYAAALSAVFGRMRGQRGKGAAAAVLFAVFFVCGIMLFLVSQAMGGMGAALFFLFMAVSAVAFGAFFIFLASHFREIRKGMLFLFFVYVLSVLYMTVFSRLGIHNESVKLEIFGTVAETIRTGSPEPARHLLLNGAMFVPMGLLLPMAEPKRLAGAGCVLAAGLVLSTSIESAQMIWEIGQCDIDDIISNTLGALTGFIIYGLFFRRYYETIDD